MKSFDIQVNGYAGADFNSDALDAESLHGACEWLRNEGVEGILATIITDGADTMARRLARLVSLRSSDPLVEQIIWGIHIEGPFLSPEAGYAGAHPVEAVCPADGAMMERLLEAAGDLTRLVTLAPEHDSGFRVTRMLADRGIRVAAGHCNSTLETLEAAADEGLSLFTHLGNGCPLLLHRHDNIVQRVLSLADRLWISFIADGVHVPLPALGNYLRSAGLEKAIVVTDAISAAGMGPGEYTIGDQEVVVDDQLATWAADRSHLVGSACTVTQACRNLEAGLRLSEADVAKLTWHNPRRALGMTS